MLGGDRDSLVICAVSTPSGYGGISVIRLSGKQASSVIRKVFHKLPDKIESHKAYYGHILESASKKQIDQVVVLYFAEGQSYTGEETFEISCHGNPVLCERIIKSLIDSGAVSAQAGEFTYRAFMNNRLDLVQAESVLSLIESRSQKAAELSLRQLEGDLSTELQTIESDLTWCLAHIEAGIDFSTEGLESATQTELIQRLSSCENAVEKLVQTYKSGKKIQEGIRVALVGRPNVGKSSLLNLVLGYERAIVTPTPGTTRDVVDADIVYMGQRFVFQDTAGLRDETQDQIEKMGMEKSKQAALGADVILFVFDSGLGWTAEDQKWAQGLDLQKTLVIANKKDQMTQEKQPQILKNLQSMTGLSKSPVRFVSALDKKDRELILKQIQDAQADQRTSENEVLLSHARHYENLVKAQQFMKQAIEALHNQLGAEFVSLELKEALVGLQETLGKRFDDQIMDRVFKEFCIGK